MNIVKILSDKAYSNVDSLNYLVPIEHNLVLPNIQDQEVSNIIKALKNTFKITAVVLVFLYYIM